MNIKRFHQQPNEGTDLKMMIVLYQKFIAVAKDGHFIMYPLEDGRLHHAGQLCRFRNRKYIKILRTDHYVYGHVFAEPFVHTFELGIAETYQFVVYHHTVQDITFPDKIGHKRIGRFIVNINGSADLLDSSFAHDDNRIAQRQCFLLIVGDIYKSDP